MSTTLTKRRSRDMVQQELKRYHDDALYFEERRQELTKQYPDQWIAVYNKQVVGTSKDPKRLLAQLKRKGIPPNQVFLEHLSTKEDILILFSLAS